MKASIPIPNQIPTMPHKMIMGVEACINAALNGNIAQIEISAGENMDSAKKVRLIVIPDTAGDIKDGNRTITVPENLGDMKEVER